MGNISVKKEKKTFIWVDPAYAWKYRTFVPNYSDKRHSLYFLFDHCLPIELRTTKTIPHLVFVGRNLCQLGEMMAVMTVERVKVRYLEMFYFEECVHNRIEKQLNNHFTVNAFSPQLIEEEPEELIPRLIRLFKWTKPKERGVKVLEPQFALESRQMQNQR